MQKRQKLSLFSIFCFNICIFLGTNTVFATQISDSSGNLAPNFVKNETTPTVMTASNDFKVPSFILPDTNPEKSTLNTEKIFNDPKIDELTPKTKDVVVKEEIVIKEIKQEKTAKHLPTVKTKNTLVVPVSDNLNKQIGIEIVTEGQENAPIAQIEIPTQKPAPKKDLLLPLKPLAKNNIKVSDSNDMPKPVLTSFESKYAKNAVKANKNIDSNTLSVIPKEIKVAFYPNSVEYSGSSVKWIQLFALKALANPQTAIEIKISETNPDLQKQRLAVITGVLENYGLSTHQIFVSKTNRPENNLVLQTILKPEEKSTVKVTTLSGTIKEKETINW